MTTLTVTFELTDSGMQINAGVDAPPDAKLSELAAANRSLQAVATYVKFVSMASKTDAVIAESSKPFTRRP